MKIVTEYFFIFKSIDFLPRNCKSRWPVFLTGYLEKQLELLTLRPNNWSPKAGLGTRDQKSKHGALVFLDFFVIMDDKRHCPYYKKFLSHDRHDPWMIYRSANCFIPSTSIRLSSPSLPSSPKRTDKQP